MTRTLNLGIMNLAELDISRIKCLKLVFDVDEKKRPQAACHIDDAVGAGIAHAIHDPLAEFRVAAPRCDGIAHRDVYNGRSGSRGFQTCGRNLFGSYRQRPMKSSC